jgi:hypothetical protein
VALSALQSAKVRRTLLCVVPFLSLAGVAYALRLGASGAVSAATLVAGPKAAPQGTFQWLLRAYEETQGAKIPKTRAVIVVHARSGDSVGRFEGTTTDDGWLVVSMPLETKRPDAPIEVSAFERGDLQPLLMDVIRLNPTPGKVEPMVPLHADQRTGPLDIQLFLPTAVAPVGGAVPLLVRVGGVDHANAALMQFNVATEDGLELSPPLRCHDGYLLSATAKFPVTGLRATVSTGDAAQKSTWFGALPTASGAARLTGTGLPEVQAMNARTSLYAELLGRKGKRWAQVLPLTDGRAQVPMPSLSEDPEWLLIAPEPFDGPGFAAAAVAYPLVPAPSQADSYFDAADPGASYIRMGSLRARPFSEVRVDGLELARSRTRARVRKGVTIAAIALVLGALVEVALMIIGSRIAQAEIDAAFAAEEPKLAKAPSDALWVGIGLAVLGFATILALITFAR